MKLCLRYLRGFALALAMAATAVSANAATHTVQIVNFEFSPQNITIEAGDTVTWEQLDDMPHTATHTGNPPLWDSGTLDQNETYSFTFNDVGAFDYLCTLHPDMTGTITVEAGQSTPPTVAITAPANNATFPPGDVIIEVEASAEAPDTVSMVEFFAGENSLGTDNEAPWSLTHTFAAGTHVLTARATSGGGTATSDAVTITVGPVRTPIDNPFPPLAKSDLTVELETVLDGLVSPLGLIATADGRLFVYEQTGIVHVIENGEKLAEPLLDVSARMVDLRENYDERGLLGLALHPDFANNGLLYTYTSEDVDGEAIFPLPGLTPNHQSVVAEWKVLAANPNQVDVASRREVLRIDQPQSNHNGGVMHFGPDGYLYIALGDGGGRDDEAAGHSPGGNGQDLNKILGKIIRIDADTPTETAGYSVPSDNPFVGVDGLDEIYAYGFRNPFSWSFDKMTGEMYVADVGQGMIEELNRVFKGGNYGWPIKEGSFYFDNGGEEDGFITAVPPAGGAPENLIDPIAEFDHSEGTAVVGGHVYYGTQIPALIGKYVLADWGRFDTPSSGRIFFLDRSEFREFRIGLDDRDLGIWVKGVGTDAAGELYILGSSTLGPDGTTGKVLKIVPLQSTLQLTIAPGEDSTLNLSWENGVGPFLLQVKTSLDESIWRIVSATDSRSATIEPSGDAAFYRVVDMGGNGAIPFTAHLTGAAERPNPVTTTASGSGTFSLEGNTLHFDIRYQGLSGAATRAHIHGPAPAAEAASVLIDLEPYNGGAWGASGTLSGSVVLTPIQKAHLLAGHTYVNIHTAANTPGEIRGQIAPVLFAAQFSGAAERPEPVDTTGTGNAILMLVGNKLTFNLNYRDLLGNATMAHIHGPATLEGSGGIMEHIGTLPDSILADRGTMGGTITLSDASLAALIDGLTYLNIHSSHVGSGEVRGQILPQTGAVPLTAIFSGAAEKPTAVDTPAKGTGTFALEGHTLHFTIRYSGLKAAATMAHIHGPAAASEAAGVLVHLTPHNGGALGTTGTFSGSVELTDQQRAWILEGRTYVNIHTSAHPTGEIRGQIAPVLMHTTILAASERPAAFNLPGNGRGSLLLVENDLTFNITYSDLSAAASNAHIHGPAPTSESNGVMVPLGPFNGGAFGVDGSFAGTAELTQPQLEALIDELTYINIHTPTHMPGEVRGQIIR